MNGHKSGGISRHFVMLPGAVLNYVNELKKRLQMQKLLQILW